MGTQEEVAEGREQREGGVGVPGLQVILTFCRPWAPQRMPHTPALCCRRKKISCWTAPRWKFQTARSRRRPSWLARRGGHPRQVRRSWWGGAANGDGQGAKGNTLLKHLLYTPVLRAVPCVTWGKGLYLSLPECPIYNGDDSKCLLLVWGGLDGIIWVNESRAWQSGQSVSLHSY